jgi:glycosyltransferase involved in cell wall biosynthesis
MKISAIIPCYNEEKTIEKVIRNIPKEVFEIIVVDNNSTDKTAEIAKKLGAKVVREKKQGYGYALQRGLKKAQGDIIVTLDGDGQYPGEKINELVNYFIENNLDFLNCARFPLKNPSSMPFIRKLGNYFFNFVTFILFGIKTKDSQSGMMIFKKEILKKINLESGDMPLSEELKIKTILSGFKYDETNIPYYPREGESKLFPFKHGLINLGFLFNLWWQNRKNKILISFLSLTIVILVFSYLASFNLSKEFYNVTSDVNGENGLAVLNWLNVGIFNLKFGKYVAGYLEKENFDFQKIRKDFYTHHPVFYLFPTYFLYKIFGISEVTTRAGIFIMFLIGLIFFYFALYKISKSLIFTFLSSLILVILPAFVYYGTTFELAVFGLPTALITFSLFIFYLNSKKEIYFYFILASIFLGGLMAWFYFFMPASIWFYILLFEKNKDFSKQRKKLLIWLPIISIFIFSLNIIHFYILKGPEVLPDLKNAFLGRSQKLPLIPWFQTLQFRLDQAYTKFFLLFSLAGLFFFFSKFKKHKIFLPLLLMPILVTLVFSQWVTHPFGVIFFAPIIALLTVIFIKESVLDIKNNFLKIPILFLFLVIAFYFSYKGLNFWVNKFLILDPNDIRLLQEIKNQIKNNELCLGKNDMGLYYGGIVMWYLRKNIFFSPDCLENQDIKYALIFNPQFGKFYQEEAQKFLNQNFKPIGCSGAFCLLSK